MIIMTIASTTPVVMAPRTVLRGFMVLGLPSAGHHIGRPSYCSDCDKASSGLKNRRGPPIIQCVTRCAGAPRVPLYQDLHPGCGRVVYGLSAYAGRDRILDGDDQRRPMAAPRRPGRTPQGAPAATRAPALSPLNRG